MRYPSDGATSNSIIKNPLSPKLGEWNRNLTTTSIRYCEIDDSSTVCHSGDSNMNSTSERIFGRHDDNNYVDPCKVSEMGVSSINNKNPSPSRREREHGRSMSSPRSKAASNEFDPFFGPTPAFGSNIRTDKYASARDSVFDLIDASPVVSRGRMMEGGDVDSGFLRSKTTYQDAVSSNRKDKHSGRGAATTGTSAAKEYSSATKKSYTSATWGVSADVDDGAQWDRTYIDNDSNNDNWRFFNQSNSGEEGNTVEATTGFSRTNQVGTRPGTDSNRGKHTHPIPLAVDALVSNSVGTADRPISLFEIAGVRDALDKREHDLRHHATMKKLSRNEELARDLDVLNNARVKKTQDRTDKKLMAASFSTISAADSVDAAANDNIPMVGKKVGTPVSQGVVSRHESVAIANTYGATVTSNSTAVSRSRNDDKGNKVPESGKTIKEGRTGIMRLFGAVGAGNHNSNKKNSTNTFFLRRKSGETDVKDRATTSDEQSIVALHSPTENVVAHQVIDKSLAHPPSVSRIKTPTDRSPNMSNFASSRLPTSDLRIAPNDELIPATERRMRSLSPDHGISRATRSPDRQRLDVPDQPDKNIFFVDENTKKTIFEFEANFDVKASPRLNKSKPGYVQYREELNTKQDVKCTSPDPFDVNSPIFCSAEDPFSSQVRKKHSKTLPMGHRSFPTINPVESDEFSDPFFPTIKGRTIPTEMVNEVTSVQRGIVHSDPTLDPLNLPDSDEDDAGSSIVAPDSRFCDRDISGEEKKESELYDDEGELFLSGTSPRTPKNYEKTTEAFRNKSTLPASPEQQKRVSTKTIATIAQIVVPPPPPPPLPPSYDKKTKSSSAFKKGNKRLESKSRKASSSNTGTANIGMVHDNLNEVSAVMAAKTNIQQTKQEILVLSSSIAKKVKQRQQKRMLGRSTPPVETKRDKLENIQSQTMSHTEGKVTPIVRSSSISRHSPVIASACKSPRTKSPIKTITIPSKHASESPSSNHKKFGHRALKEKSTSSIPTPISRSLKHYPKRSQNALAQTNSDLERCEDAEFLPHKESPIRGTSPFNTSKKILQRRGRSVTRQLSNDSLDEMPSKNRVPIPSASRKRISTVSIPKQKQAITVVKPKKSVDVFPSHQQASSYSGDEDLHPPILRQGTLESLSSVGSDIQRLRSILRRSRGTDPDERNLYLEPFQSAFAVYDEKEIKDPMQRAGLRLLSAAVVPIQALARRHLALRLALTRMWAIVVIEAAIRRWFCQSSFQYQKKSIILIQSAVRGSRVRDQLLLEQCCAIEIQRHVRGLLATLKVYEDVYKITVCQACVRKKLAINYAMDRMVSTIQIQSLARGFLTRMARDRLNRATMKVQALWRSYACRFSYQVDLLDIIVIQSIVRRNAAMLQYRNLQDERIFFASTVIQKNWRRYDCLVNYNEYRSAVFIQKIWRAYDCRVNYREFRAATIIQSFWRGHVSRVVYKDHKASTVIQALWRGRVKRAYFLRYSRATRIQSYWRMLVARKSYRGVCAAITIQSQWRSYDCTMNFLHFLADVLIVQSSVRRWMALRKCNSMKKRYATTIQCAFRVYSAYQQLKKRQAALIIQKAWRGFVHYADYMFTISDIVVAQSIIRRWLSTKRYPELISQRNTRSAVTIQKNWRRHAQVEVYNGMLREKEAAIIIQSLWRQYTARLSFITYIDSVTQIEAVCRGYLVRQSYLTKQYCAMVIQSMIRNRLATKTACYVAKGRSLVDDSFTLASNESQQALLAQKLWRGFFIRYHITLFLQARKIQALLRGYLARSSFQIFCQTRTIQNAWRSYKARLQLTENVSCRKLQTTWRGYIAKKSYDHYTASRTIQSSWRGYVVRVEIALFLTARSIQAMWRGYFVKKQYQQYLSARAIQTEWRRFFQEKHYIVYVCTRTIQTSWRAYQSRIGYKSYCGARRIQAVWRGFSQFRRLVSYLSARSIQSAWRGFCQYQKYVVYINARSIQSVWRGFSQYRRLVSYLSVRSIQSAWRGFSQYRKYVVYINARRIQSVWRGFSQYRRLVSYLSVRSIQSAWRGFSQYRKYVAYTSARSIQSAWRGLVQYRKYVVYDSARSIQSAWRGFSQYRKFVYYLSARNIQATWRGFSIYKQYVLYASARRIQSYWRGNSLRKQFVSYKSAKSIQSAWRGYWFRVNYVLYTSARSIQTAWRGHSLRTQFVLFLTVRTIQSNWRGYAVRLERDKYNSARALQALWRGYSSRIHYSSYQCARIIQAVFRGHLTRVDMALYRKARAIQCCWRGYVVRVTVSLYISARRIQSSWRGHSARCAVERKIVLVAEQQYCAAIKIQSVWRCISARIFYIEYIAARSIQCKWRGFYLRTVYLEYVAARTIQAQWRRQSIRTVYVEYVSARSIQAQWRKFSLRLIFTEYVAARKIQAKWRQFALHSIFREYIAARRIQTQWRKYSLRTIFKEYVASRQIQTQWRKYSLRTIFKEYVASRQIQTQWRKYSHRTIFKEYVASRQIQTQWRKYSLRSAFVEYMAARRIQSIWRGFLLRNVYIEYVASRVIQSMWRGYAFRATRDRASIRIQTIWRGACLRLAFREYTAARSIQAMWRGVALRAAYIEYFAVRSIQAAWRGFSFRTAFVEYISARKIQAIWRSVKVRDSYRRYTAVRKIQAVWKGTVTRTAYKCYTSARTLQAFWRGRRLSVAYHVFIAARRIQSFWRCRRQVGAFRRLLAAVAIQRHWRGYVLKSAYREFLAARKIQAFWRGSRLRIAYIVCMAAVKIQSHWRRLRCQTMSHVLRREIYSAQIIQTRWRVFVVRTTYTQHCAAKSIQSFWRGLCVRCNFIYYIAARRIQTTWRKSQHQSRYRKFLAARLIQKIWRGRFVYSAYVYFVSARLVQKVWRMKLVRSSYIEYRSATAIQTKWRQVVLASAYVHFISARRIQNAWRRKLETNQLRQYLICEGLEMRTSKIAANEIEASVLIQACWRRFGIYVSYRTFVSARKIQTLWRCKSTQTSYLQYKASQQIQSFWHCKLLPTGSPNQNDSVDLESASAIRMQPLYSPRDKNATNEKESSQHTLMFDAARIIQQNWRCFYARQSFWHILGSSIQIQAVIRGHLMRNRLSTSRVTGNDFSSRYLAESSNQNLSTIAKLEVPSESRNNLETSINFDRWLEMAWGDTISGSESCHNPPKENAIYDILNSLVGKDKIATRQRRLIGSHVACSALLQKTSPSSRLYGMSNIALDADLTLEEAWIDAEIYDAKSRRRAERKSAKVRTSFLSDCYAVNTKCTQSQS